MESSAAFAFALVLVGGIFNGSFVFPMKLMPGWKWENSWLVYSVSLLLVPWIAALVTVPQLGEVLASAPAGVITRVFLFGFGWGIGSVLFGLGVSQMGLAIGYGLILGLIAPIGTFLPLAVLHPERLWTRQGFALMIGTGIVLIGIFLCALAARIRESAHKAGNFRKGLLICILAGIFSPMLNFSFVFGEELRDRALQFGASQAMASNAIWCLTLTSGCLVNAAYCVYLLNRNRTWSYFTVKNPPSGYWIGGNMISILCFASFLTYGAGATALGSLGGIVGWPLFMSMALITSNSLGALSGEWRGAPRRAWLLSTAGIAVLIVAITVIARGSN